MKDSEITKLRRARTRVHWQLHKLEPMVAGYKAKLADLEARIAAIAPDLLLPPRRHAPNPYFARRELPRLILDIMREANGPIATKTIALRALAMKGCPLPDPRTMRRTRVLISKTFAHWAKRGLVASVGSGNTTRRVLVAPR